MEKCITCNNGAQGVRDLVPCSNNIRRTNSKFGEVLELMGWDMGDRSTWNTTLVCKGCINIISRWSTCQGKLVLLNGEWMERTGRTSPCIPPPKRDQKRRLNCKKSKFHAFLDHSKYGKLLRAFRKDRKVAPYFLREVKKMIREEMRFLESDECLFVVNSALDGDKVNDWETILKRIQEKAPTLYSTLLAVLSRSDNPKNFNHLLKSRLGMMFLIPLHHRFPRRYRIPRHLPLRFSRLLFKCDTTVKRVYQKSEDSKLEFGVASGFVQKPPTKPTSVVLHWKNTIEKEKILTSGGLLAGEDMHPGYSLVISSTRGKSKGLPVCNAYAVKNRVSFRDLQENTTVKASDLPLKTYLPSQKDYVELRMRMRVLVERILKANLYVFSDQPTLEHIPHKYSKECSRKSEYLDLRTIDFLEKPSQHEAMLQILDMLSKLVPNDHEVPLHADQEAISMVSSARKKSSKDLISAKKLPSNNQEATVMVLPAKETACKDPGLLLSSRRSVRKSASKDPSPVRETASLDTSSATKTTPRDTTSDDHVSCLLPLPQDLREVIVRDLIAELFTPTQATEKGTLRHLQEYFGLRGVDDQTSSFRHTDDFLSFIACAFVIGFAKEILRNPSFSRHKPKLDPVADEIVRRIWHQLPMNRVADILNAPLDDYEDQFCFCKEYLEEVDMVECCNIDCPNGRWFHTDCVMHVEAEGEWFCSSYCQHSNMGLFCICRQKGEEGTDLTCANKSCPRGERFHSQCVRSTLPIEDEDEWYCSTACSKEGGGDSDERDELMEYLQRVTWCSLFSECIRDAEREGDGLASIAYWRISMPELFVRGHEQHVAATHRLLAGTSGCFPPRIQEEVIHNRTLSLHGGQGKNVSLNFPAEQMDDAELPSHYSRKQGKILENKLKLGKRSWKKEKETEWFARYQEDIKKFIDNFGDMFCEMKGRIVPSLCNKVVGREINQEKAAHMKESLLKLNKKFDEEMMLKYHHSV